VGLRGCTPLQAVVQAPTATDSLKRIQPTVAAGTAIAETVSGADSVALATFFKTSSNDALVPVDGTLEPIRIARDELAGAALRRVHLRRTRPDGRNAKPGEGDIVLSGIRVYNRHRKQRTQHFAQGGLIMECFDRDEKLLHRIQKNPARAAVFYQFNLAGPPATVHRIRLFKSGSGVVTFSEVIFCSNHSCRAARPTQLAYNATLPSGTPEIFRLLRKSLTPRGECRALSASPQFQYSYCGMLSPEMGCSSFAVSNATTFVLDAEFLSKMNQGGCAVTSLSPEHPELSDSGRFANANLREWERVAWCSTTSKSNTCNLVEDFVRHVGRTDATVLYADVSASDWRRPDSLLRLVSRIAASNLFLPLRLMAESLSDPQVTQHRKDLLKIYSVQAMHVAPNAQPVELREGSLQVPSEIQLSLRLAVTITYDAMSDPRSIDSYVKRWTGQDLNTMKLPIADPGYIPKRLFATWKSKELPRKAQEIWEVWGTNEPELDRVILDDRECSRLAERFPRLKPRYDALPLNVMRADVCRVLGVYFFGGIYKDLDVAYVRRSRTGSASTTKSSADGRIRNTCANGSSPLAQATAAYGASSSTLPTSLRTRRSSTSTRTSKRSLTSRAPACGPTPCRAALRLPSTAWRRCSSPTSITTTPRSDGVHYMALLHCEKFMKCECTKNFKKKWTN
jgi:hypothetical protein